MEGERERERWRNYHRTQIGRAPDSREPAPAARQAANASECLPLAFLQPSGWNCSAGCAQGFYPAIASLSIGGTHEYVYRSPIIMHAVGAALTHNIHGGEGVARSLLEIALEAENII
jgi:hypothetical protein